MKQGNAMNDTYIVTAFVVIDDILKAFALKRRWHDGIGPWWLPMPPGQFGPLSCHFPDRMLVSTGYLSGTLKVAAANCLLDTGMVACRGQFVRFPKADSLPRSA
jgi:hypothetical protein